MCQGFGGMNDLIGGAYRWQHGLACKLCAGDTLDALRDGAWNEWTGLLAAIMHGADDRRPLLDWTGNMINEIAHSCGGSL